MRCGGSAARTLVAAAQAERIVLVSLAVNRVQAFQCPCEIDTSPPAGTYSILRRSLIERKRMPIAAFTFGDATLTIVELAFMFLWIWIAIGVVFDIFRSQDLSNWQSRLGAGDIRVSADRRLGLSDRERAHDA
jgi:hypothetical protein